MYLLPLDIAAPHLEYRLLAPLLLVLLGACLAVLVESTSRRGPRYGSQLIVTSVTLVLALATLARNWHIGTRTIGAEGAIALDGPAYAGWAGLLVFGLLTALLFAERQVSGGQSQFTAMGSSVPGSPLEREAIAARAEHTEVFPLLLFSLFGMMLLLAANDMIVMFVGLEILSLPLYLLAGLARRRRMLSQEAALKYFLLGALSSAFFVYGAALLYGYSGSFSLNGIDAAVTNGVDNRGLLLAGMGLVLIGLLFKVGAVPFHNWTPDVYTGSPTPVTGFMAICTKLAAVMALTRVLFVALGGARWTWAPIVALVAVLTMVVGSVASVVQNDIKRLLAYSAIVHAGFLLVAVTGAVAAGNGLVSHSVGSVSAVMFYLVAYGLAVLAAFAMVTMVRRAGGEATSLDQWRGLGRRNPVLGVMMSVVMLSFAGIPPTAGFVGKLVLFTAAWKGGYPWLAVVAIAASLVAAYAYLRIIVVLFFTDGGSEAEVVNPSWMTWVVIWVGVIGSIGLGLFSAPLLNLFENASGFLR